MKVYAMSKLFAVETTKDLPVLHAVISITDLKSPAPDFAPNTQRVAELHQRFYDIDDALKGTEYEVGLFTDAQAQEIVAFVRRNMKDVKVLIVNCDAGVSRSAGVAAAILKATTGSDEQIFKDPRYLPNMWVYRKVLNAFMEVCDG